MSAKEKHSWWKSKEAPGRNPRDDANSSHVIDREEDHTGSIDVVEGVGRDRLTHCSPRAEFRVIIAHRIVAVRRLESGREGDE